MDHIAAVEERIVSDRLRRKLEEVNVAAQNQLSPIQDHVNFTLQASVFLFYLLFSIRLVFLYFFLLKIVVPSF